MSEKDKRKNLVADLAEKAKEALAEVVYDSISDVYALYKRTGKKTAFPFRVTLEAADGGVTGVKVVASLDLSVIKPHWESRALVAKGDRADELKCQECGNPVSQCECEAEPVSGGAAISPEEAEEVLDATEAADEAEAPEAPDPEAADGDDEYLDPSALSQSQPAPRPNFKAGESPSDIAV